MKILSARLLLTVLAFAVGSLFHAAIAQNQETQNAADLSSEIYNSLQQIIDQAEDPTSQSQAMQEKSAVVALAELKRLAEDIDVLKRLLENGKSLDQTLPHYRSVAFRRKNVRFFAEGIEIRETIREQALAAGRLMDQLDQIYK